MSEEAKVATGSLYDEVSWDKIEFNAIDRKDFDRIKMLNQIAYCTFLGPSDGLSFFMFRPLPWGEFKDIRKQNLDKEDMHDAIVTAALLWPEPDPIMINSISAGFILTLVHQILAVSNFLKSPDKALEMILEA